MGNKSSSPTGKSPKGQGVSGIIQEGRPPGRDNGPSGSLPDLKNDVSITLDPGTLENQTHFPKNFSMKVRDSSEIGGKPVRAKSTYPNNPIHEEDHYDIADPGTDLAMPRGFPDFRGSGQFDVYWKSLDQVTSIWPEYHPIRDIDVHSLKTPVRQTLQQVLKRLSEQHDLIRKMSADQHECRQELVELKEEVNANQQQLRKKDQENRSFKEDILILRAELKKYRGQDDRSIPDHSRRILSDSALPDMEPIHNGYDPDYEEHKKFRKRERDGIFKPTPLLLAEGGRAESRRVVERSSSLKPAKGESPGRGRYNDHVGAAQNDVKDQLWHTKLALEKEKRDNEILRRLTSRDSESTVSISSVRLKKKVSLDEYRNRYISLEELMLGKVATCLSNQLSHTSSKRQQQFACAVVQKSYDVAMDTVVKFKDMVKTLINNPAKASSLSERSNYKQSGELAGQIKLFEYFKPGYGINEGMSKLAKKTQAMEELPEVLTKQIYDYLEGMADITNIIDIVEAVVDAVRMEYGDCTTSSLLNKAEFSDFIHDCCRFSWQACVISQPLFVSSAHQWRYEERCHVTSVDNGRTNAKIDYYILPILFSKKNGGEILYKGRVCV